MRGCLSSTNFSILMNGSPKGWVEASRGLGQGYPLSSFLFTLVVDVKAFVWLVVHRKVNINDLIQLR